MMDFSGCLNDESIGPTVQGCRGEFDFTIKFESIFFELIPTAVFIALCLPRTAYLLRRPVFVHGAFLKGVKLTAICFYAALQLSLLTLSCIKSSRFKAFLVSSSALTFLSSLFMLAVSYLEHSRSPRPSILLSAYLSFSILLDVAQTRTFWLASGNSDETVFCALFTAAVVVEALIFIIESRRKSNWIQWTDMKEHSPEETTGLFGLGAFVWLNKLFLTGYKKVMVLDDLYALDRNIASKALQPKLKVRLEHLYSRGLGRKHGLAKALAKALAVQLLLPVGPRIAMGAFQFCQPFLINTLLDYLQQSEDDVSRNVGYGLIGATVLIYTGIATSGALYWYFQERAMYMARGALAGAIYEKTVDATVSAADDSAALTLMSADVERVIRGCLNIHEFWANTIQVGLACWLLSLQIGAAFVTPLIVIGFCVVCSTILSRYTGPRQKLWMEKIQKRVGLTSKVIGQMKHLKMSGLSHQVEHSIQSMRVDELRTGARFRIIQTLSAVLAYTPLCISPVITFALSSQTLGVTRIFTSISYILLLATPLGVLFQTVPSLLAAFTCLARIQEFLEKDSHLDFRKPAQIDSSSESMRLDDSNEKEAPAMEIRGGGFGWHADKLSLKGIDIRIPKSRLTIAIGPVASGKSTLCKVLLGETPVAHGQITMTNFGRLGSGSRVGYCDQTPYLTNATIRENIVGFAPFDEKRYNEVIEAAMLQYDLDVLLPQGDQTKVGSNGITLSGGQKQRVSIARALYLDSIFLVFDDILSGLDADTEEQVFRKVFSSDGILRRRGATVVLCTHSVRHLRSADHIIALGPDGSLVEQGTFQELMANKKYVYSLGIRESASSKSEDEIESIEEALDTSTRRPGSQAPRASRPILSRNTRRQEQGRMLGDISVYRHYFSRINKSSILALFVFGLGWGFSYNFGTVWLKFWSEDVTSAHQARSNSFYLGLYALFQVSTLASLFFLSRTCFRTIIMVSGGKLHQEALRTVINAPLKFFTTTDTGIVTNLFSQDMTLIDGQLPMSLANLTLYAFSSIGMAAVIASSSSFVVITYPFLVVVLYGVQKFYLRTSRQIRLLDLEAKSPLYSHFIDTMKGIVTIRAFGWVPDSIELNNSYLDTSQRPAYLLAMIQRWLGFTLQLIVAILAVVVVALATQLRSKTGVTGASLVTLMTFGEALSYIVTMYTMLETSIGAVSRLKSFSEKVKSENLEGEDLIPPPEWPAKGRIDIDGVSASYLDDDEEFSRTTTPSSTSGDANTTSNNRHLALKDLNLSIAPGEKVAICGRSGSGKSSLILLLLRLLDPLPTSAKKVTIDNLPLDKIDRSTLRQRIIAVPQDTVFLPDGTSFQANLDLSSDATEDDCRSVLETVGLWSLVDQHGEGQGLASGLHPDALSQGQKQLFSLARAILRRRMRARALVGNAQDTAAGATSSGGGEKRGVGEEVDSGILLLDEVSSSVDQDTDRAMQEIIRREFEGYTIVMVSHRLDMVMGFDTVVVMDKGRVVEMGRPMILVETEGSRFRDLWLVGKE